MKRYVTQTHHTYSMTNGLKKIVEPTNAATSVVLNGYPDSCIKVNLDVRRNERLKICHVGTLGHYQNVEMLKQVISSVLLELATSLSLVRDQGNI